MLTTLKNVETLQARLDSATYDLYAEEIYSLEKLWKDSLSYLDFCDFSFIGGIDSRSIPIPLAQENFHNIIYDYRECRKIELNNVENIPSDLKTIAGGGNIPCTIYSILEYYRRNTPIEEIGRILVKYGYRTPDSGTLWSAFERILEPIYKIETTIQSSIFELCKSVSIGKPVVCMVPTKFLSEHINYNNPSLTGHECIIVWQLVGKSLLVTTTHSQGFYVLKMAETFRHILRTWACSPVR